MNEFDDHDLGERLRRLGGPMPDAHAAQAQLRRRVRVARRRRAAAWTGGAAAMLLAVAGAYAAGTRQGSTVQPATSDSTVSSTVSSTVPATTTPTSSTEATVPPAASSTPGTSTPGTSTPGTSTPSGSSAPPTTAPPVTKSFSGIGGTITVRLQSGALTLLSTQPAAGYEVTEVRTEPRRVEVRFHNGDRETRIRVEVQDGQMRPDIRETGG